MNEVEKLNEILSKNGLTDVMQLAQKMNKEQKEETEKTKERCFSDFTLTYKEEIKLQIKKQITSKVKDLIIEASKLYPKDIEFHLKEYNKIKKATDNAEKDLENAIKYIEKNTIFTDEDVIYYLTNKAMKRNEQYEHLLDIFYLNYFKALIDDRQLVTEYKELVKTDVSTEGVINIFWNDFDMLEVRERVNFFRSII